ncbi:MAG: hypothetical protein EAZ91_24305 [Cytophagales bacterium]|nr:MAG: hypothetical protein EAZ91_24305 [Cytophagales bacterium]
MRKLFTSLFLFVVLFDLSATPQSTVERVSRYVSSSQMYLEKANFKASEEMAREAVRLSELSKDKRLMAKSYSTLGIALFKAEKIIGADKYLNRSLELYRALRETSPEAIAALSTLRKLYKIANNDEAGSGKSVNPKNAEDWISRSQFYRNSPVRAQNATLSAKGALLWATYTKNSKVIARAEANLGLFQAQSTKEADIREAATHLTNARDLFYAGGIKSPEVAPVEQALDELYAKHSFLGVGPGDKYAGIEIGSKGVKMSIIRLRSDVKGEYAYSVLADTAINTEVILFTGQAINESVRAVKTLHDIALAKHGIPTRRVFTAISSGVQSQARKKNKLPLLIDIQEGVRNELSQAERSVEVITPEEEPRLTHLGVVHPEGRYDALIIDIGSGNTKGGYFADGTLNFISFWVDWGTKSLTNELEKTDFTTINDYAKAVSDKVQTIKVEEIRPAISAKSGLRNKPRVIMSGGICWAVATIMHPESMNSAYVEVTNEDVKKFREMAVKEYAQLTNRDSQLYKVQAKEDREKAKKEIGRVLDVFDQKAMIAGSDLLETVMKEFNATSVPKSYYLARYGYIGWVTGYIIRSLAGDE